MSSSARVLVLANETRSQPQRSTRSTLAKLLALNAVEAVSVFSLRLRVAEHGQAHTFAQLLQRVERFEPTAILAYHPAATGLTIPHWRSLREASGASLVYYEGDPYGRFRHTLPPEGRALAAVADTAVTVGTGVFADNLRRAGARDVRWSPSRHNSALTTETSPLRDRSTEILMIANRNNARLPHRTLPGASQRARFVRLMERRFAGRFRIYGSGWTGPSAGGPLPFWQQSAAIANSWLTVNWDHFPNEPKYFSNRLPISLAAGSVHLTGFHPRYDEVFPEHAAFIRFAPSPEELVDVVDDTLRGSSHHELIEAEREAQSWADEHLRADRQFIELLEIGGVHLPDISGEALDAAEAAEVEEY